jgi:Asp-tRNA(Asn)/Glu-tRNA(Gln) amidotransferase A subunit family amidase
LSELTIKPAVELLRMLESREISAVELATEHVREIERLDPLLRAFAHCDPERALAAALQADRSRGARPGEVLRGLPVTVKASISTAGYRCEVGSVLNRGFVASSDALAVQRLKAAGAVILGTTNCPEFLMAYETDNLLYGKTANPWSLAHSAGGSSGGEAAAVAAGLSAGGLGSDSGGSVREPAHFSGICSFKPTSGVLPSEGHLPPCVGPFAILGSIGPMARTMSDVALLFRVLAGSEIGDRLGTPKAADSELRSKPVGVLEDDGLVPVTTETRRAVRDGAAALERRGFAIREFRSKALERARQLWWTFFMRCGRMLLEPMIAGRESELSGTFCYFLETTRGEPLLTGAELLDAWTQWEPLRAELAAELSGYSALLTPVCSIPAFRHGEREWVVEGGRVEYFEAMRFTQWFNALGAPAAVVPVGSSADGLPIGVQVAARPYEDEAVLAIASLLDEDFGYHAPPMAVGECVARS